MTNKLKNWKREKKPQKTTERSQLVLKAKSFSYQILYILVIF